MSDDDLIEKLVEQYGEKYRSLFTDSLQWLTQREPVWDLDEPIDREEFIAGLVVRATPVHD